MSRTIIIGDLHGCVAEALDLFDALALGPGDRVIFTGDLVDRGPDPRGAVELAMQHESILGNHEENHLARRRSHPSKLSPEHLRTRDALGDEHYAYFASLPTTIRLREHGALVVHAGVDPRVPLHAQDPYHLLHVQCLRGDERKSYWPSKAPPDARFWAESWRGPERIIFGHTVVHEPFLGEHVAAVDTGCAYGGRLTALVLPSWTFVSVPSRQTTKKPARVATYEVLPGVRCFS
jgi:serine/threonine protein phosphatase 1